MFLLLRFFQLLSQRIFPNIIIGQFSVIVFYLFFLLFVVKIIKYNLKELYLSKDFYKNILLNFSVFTVVYFIFDKMNLIDVIFNLNNNKSNLNYFILLPIELFIVSILEELFFRKFMFFKLSNFNNFIKIFITSILFSLSHLPDKIIDFLLLFFSSVVYGIIYVKTRNVKYSMSLHIATNLSIVFFGLHDDKSFSKIVIAVNRINIFSDTFNSSDLIILICELIVLFYFVVKTNKNKEQSLLKL